MSAVRSLVPRVRVSIVPYSTETRTASGCRRRGADDRGDTQDADKNREDWPRAHASDVGVLSVATYPSFLRSGPFETVALAGTDKLGVRRRV